MKLVRLHIDNFGKLSNFNYEFKDGINTIFEQNGWGKSTLSIFIKAMLFGFDERKRSVEANNRIKYAPWNGGVYGGSLVIMIDDEQLLIERVFHPSKNNIDEFKVYDLNTNKQIFKYSSNIGEELLGINAGSFERSIFIPQSDLELGFNDDLKSKLANIVGGTNDVHSYEEAIKKITNKAKILKKNSKSGLIFDKKKELYELEQELALEKEKIDSIPSIMNQINLVEKDIASINKDIELLNFKLKENSKYEEQKQNKKMLELLNKQLAEEISKKATIDSVLNGKNINQDELQELKDKYQEYNNLSIEYNNLSNSFIEEDYQIIPEEEIDQLDSMIANLQAKKDFKMPNYLLIELIISLVGFISGLIIVFNNMILGIVFLMISLLGLLFFVFIFFNLKSQGNSFYDKELQEEFNKYGFYSTDYNSNIKQLKLQNDLIKEKQSKSDAIKEELANKRSQISKINSELESFFERFNLSSSSYQNKISELERICYSLTELNKNISNKQIEINNHINKYKLDDISEPIDFDFEDIQNQIECLNRKRLSFNNELNRLNTILDTYEDAKSKYDDISSEIENYKSDINDMVKEYNILDKTKELLEVSQEGLLAKYVKPMKDNMEKYLKLLLNDGKEFALDTDFNFYYVEDGKRKEIDFYSKGYQQLLMICLRLSLIDCLYSTELPFIVLDDPFVNLDEEKIDKSVEMLKRISDNYQVLYFTCHKSRCV